MFRKLYMQNPNPSQTVTAARKKAQARESYGTWRNGLPDGHIERFLEEGLTPLLKKYGYHPFYPLQMFTKACKEWAFAHVVIQQKGSDIYDRTFVKCAHTGGEEEFDWFLHSIPYEKWEALCAKWAAPEFLDTSDAGYCQMIDITQFAWQVIHLESSSAHIRWKALIEQSDYDEYTHSSTHAQPTEDTGAYGGDRRTL